MNARKLTRFTLMTLTAGSLLGAGFITGRLVERAENKVRDKEISYLKQHYILSEEYMKAAEDYEKLTDELIKNLKMKNGSTPGNFDSLPGIPKYGEKLNKYHI